MDRQPTVTLDHVADFYNRYPGEVVTLYTRIRVAEPLEGAVLSISLPGELSLERYRPPSAPGEIEAYVQVEGGTQYLTWPIKQAMRPGYAYEFLTMVRIGAVERDTWLESRASLVRAGDLLAEECVAVYVRTKGRYLRYLPELYERDELMGRFLMLFESFWAPLEMQIKGIHHYFDPAMTPSHFLPWLASWVGAELSAGLTEEQWRHLIRVAVSLHRRRGTKEGLRECLEIYTGGRVEIVEHRAQDLRLGSAARLGPGVALGTGNRPHTFTVTIYLDEEAGARPGKARESAIGALIESIKPAHTDYTLRIKGLAED